uniref:Uncharacterized protein n=1 Tax=Pipistrellus kuhlii TaxID=59472 RepID=A0A7J7XB03_PIPKU|nr:hypothetical protein mPipKuh1_010595 [Pipistrellus kuhlii]
MEGTSFILPGPKFSHPLLKCALSPSAPRAVSCGSWEGKYRGQLLLCSWPAEGLGGEQPPFPEAARSAPPGAQARGPGRAVMWIPESVPIHPADPSRPTVLPAGAGGGRKRTTSLAAGPPKHRSHSLHINHGKDSTLPPGREEAAYFIRLAARVSAPKFSPG